MSTLSGDLGKAIANHLRDQSPEVEMWDGNGFAPVPFEVSFAWLPRVKAEALLTPRIVVSSRTEESEVEGRDLLQHTLTLDVGIMAKLRRGESEVESELSRLTAVATRVRRWLSYTDFTLDDGTVAGFTGATIETLVADEHLDQQRVFTAIVSVSYAVYEELNQEQGG